MSDNSGLDKDRIAAEVLELAERVDKAYRTNDSELYAETLDEDAIVSIPGKPPVRGREALKSMFESRPPLPPGATFEVNPTEIEIISGDWAYAFGTDTFTVPISHGAPVVETMTFMVLIRRTSEGWKTFREVLSAD